MMLQSSGDPPIDRFRNNEVTDTSLREMVELAQTDDSRGFTALFQLYNGQICTYLSRLVGNDDVGRDLAQETFLRVWRSLPTIPGKLEFRPWLYRIATNVARSHLRHERLIQWLPWKEQTVNSSLESLSVAGPEERLGDIEPVKQALAYLSPQYRTCLLLQLVGGFSQREIGQMLGISEKSVSSNVSRGREQFRQACRNLKGKEAQ